VSVADRERTLAALRATSIEDDEELLRQSQNDNDSDDMGVRTAIQYRIGLKKALAKFVPMS
jgi:hypothetical protein